MTVRLKLLKDEIKQPYFIALKQFLWDEGVRGPDERLPTCKIYPARKSFKTITVYIYHMTVLTSPGYLCMVKYTFGEGQGGYNRAR